MLHLDKSKLAAHHLEHISLLSVFARVCLLIGKKFWHFQLQSILINDDCILPYDGVHLVHSDFRDDLRPK